MHFRKGVRLVYLFAVDTGHHVQFVWNELVHVVSNIRHVFKFRHYIIVCVEYIIYSTQKNKNQFYQGTVGSWKLRFHLRLRRNPLTPSLYNQVFNCYRLYRYSLRICRIWTHSVQDLVASRRRNPLTLHYNPDRAPLEQSDDILGKFRTLMKIVCNQFSPSYITGSRV